MSVILESLYKEIKEFKVKLVAGEDGLKNDVSWIHVVESAEIASFLQGREVVFVTGIGLKDDYELLDLVKLSHKNKSSAIIVNIGYYIKNIKSEVVDYCNQNNLPIFSVPWEVRMPDIMKVLTSKIIETEKQYLEKNNAMREAIFSPLCKEIYLPVLKKLGFESNWKYTVATIELDVLAAWNIGVYISKVKKIITKKLKEIEDQYCILEVNNMIIVVFYNIEEEKIETSIKSIKIESEKIYNDVKVYYGIGKVKKNLEKLCDSYNEGRLVIKINKKINKNNVYTSYKNLGICKIFDWAENDYKLKAFYEETLGEIERYDKTNGTDYIDLIKCFFKNECKVNETANELFVHRNTVNYKINKIKEILDCDFLDLSKKSEIYIALLIKYLI